MQTTEIITSTRWNIDPVHSIIGFKVRHLVVTNVRGECKEYAARIYTRGEDYHSIEIDVLINPASVSTGDVAGDAHLKGAGFFDVAFFKEINFRAASLEEAEGEMYVLHGDLTMKGITKKIRLDIELDGVTKGPKSILYGYRQN